MAGERRSEELTLAVPGATTWRRRRSLRRGPRRGADAVPAAGGLAHFHGSARRFDLKGQAGSARVDDYATTPREVSRPSVRLGRGARTTACSRSSSPPVLQDPRVREPSAVPWNRRTSRA
ncbi:hypothetical protein QJS66_05505 [Kocuria rhizophila]|nr:hypothetical protein QJS66_05505 [Kocuria rhizophila]